MRTTPQRSMTSNSYISNIVRGSDKKNDDAARSGGTRQRSRSNSTDGSSDADGGMNINVTRMKTSAKHVIIGASPRSSSSGGAGMARLRRRVRGGSTNKKKKPVSPGVFKLFVIGGSFLIFFLWRLASLIQLLEDPSYAMDSSSSLADLPDNNATLNGGASTTAKRHPFWESLRERRRNAFTRLVGSSNTIHHDGREEQDNKAAVQAAAKEKFLLAQQQQQQEQYQPAQQQHQHHHPAPPAAAGLAGVAVDRGQEEEVKKKTLSYYESNSTSSNLVDMRQLSYELPFDNPDGGSWKQGWDVEPLSPVDESHPLQIFVVPHSHCDPGWIKTFDDYFKSQTTKIITTVVNALAKDKRRKFIWAEISYFQWWWTDQGPEQRQLALDLLASGQLEFVTGGWVQPDEANSELYAMEIQLQEGHDWINQTVGAQYIPKYAWSIDPFGYSPTMAWLLKKYGFHAMLIQRVHYAVKKELAKRKHLEFYWRQVWDTTGEHDIFTHVMPFYSYDAPHSCGPDPSVCCQFDFARYPVGHAPNVNCPWGKPPQAITETNVVERALLLLDQYKKKANLYRGRVVLAPLGDDFRYQTAQEAEDQFNNYQKIFDYINDNVPGVQIQFGTLSEYFKAAMVGSFEPPLLKGSFFTYSDVNQDYWSGYFTSRVFDKALDRQLERVLFAATQMGATKEELKEPRRALSLFQHHDGVAGTAKDHVVEDYARRIHEAISFTQEWLVTRMKALDPHLVQPTEDIKACWQSGAPRDIKQNLCGDDGTAVIVYNPLDTPQTCGDIVIPGQKFQVAELPCETPGNKADWSPTSIVFDQTTGLMLEPIKEEWMVWRVTRGGAYLFVPGKLVPYDLKQNHVRVEHDGYVVMTDDWKRTVVEKEVPTEFGATATVVDFVFETNLTADNEEWIVRFSGNIKNGGVFHTDLNGFNFDTHHFRADMPIQSQVFPMPTLASIEDMSSRLTVLSEHAQGTASLQDGSIDLWLDRRLRQDDARGLNQGIRDNRPTRSRLRLLLEHDGYDSANEFNVTQVGWRMWNELQHPLEMFGHLQHPITPMPAVVAAKHLVRVRPPPKAPVVEVKNEDRAITNATIDMRQLNREMAFDNPDGGAWKQGWDVQPVEVDETHPLKVFVLPHSHCDPGWIKTFDEYFRSQTTNIISTVVNALAKDKRRKFIWAEISYFQWWWADQGTEQRELVRKLLKSGQLEFVTGGWVQPDEANSELYAMEIQLQEGHDWINKTVGPEHIPKYGWSIDPFGYSPTMAWLLKKYGFKAMLIQRVHYAVKKELAKRKHLEFYWRQVWDTTGEHDIFTHVMPFYSYDVPHTCGPDPSVCCQFDFRRFPVGEGMYCPWNKAPQRITDANVRERALLLLDQYKKKANLYRGNVVLVPLGDDFRYQTDKEAEDQYTNYQKIFDYINANVPGVQIQFGTLSEYFKAAMGSFEPPLLKGSFFTYSDVNQDYWSGYFTSRVFDKALDRQLERVLFAAAQMGATKEELQEPRRALSLFQHHDGVTGTAKDHVVEDYARRIHEAISFTQEWLLTRMKANDPSLEENIDDLQACWQSSLPRDLRQNLCGESGAVVLYNPLDTPQTCGDIVIPGNKVQMATLPCDTPGKKVGSLPTKIVFDPLTGQMVEPLKEEWMVWRVSAGGAYLFFPGELVAYDLHRNNVHVEQDGYVVVTDNWKRTVVERQVPAEFGATATVLDFVFETNLKADNEEWIVRFGGDIKNNGVFQTDLNGFNFDTHYFRSDMPIQSQVFPMPTLASIEDKATRLTVLSEHAQGTASLQKGSIDLWLDRRLRQDDARGLGQGVRDNRPTRSRLRVLLEHGGFDSASEFNITQLGWRMWNELQHPLEMFGSVPRKHDPSDEREQGDANLPPLFARNDRDMTNLAAKSVAEDAHSETILPDVQKHDNAGWIEAPGVAKAVVRRGGQIIE